MSDISSALLKKIEQQINQAQLGDEFSKKGEVIEIKDGVATVSGLDQALFSEIVEFPNGIKGVVLDLLEDSVGVLVLGNYSLIHVGQTVKSTGKVFSIGVGKEYLGRVLNGIGDPIDGEGSISPTEYYPVERIAPGVMTREGVNQSMETGIKAIDSMVPIGRGQRELIIGDRQTGKTTVALDTIINQRGKGVTCIYVAIGQKESKIKKIVETLKEKKALDYTIVVSAPSNAPAVMQYIAPYVGASLGEYFMYNNQDALIIYDDLTKHAAAYREISLLLRRPPGREAFPGDVFYLHSRLLERAARVTKEHGGGSLTALPIIETQAGDVSGYIATNVISITDGQIFLETDLFNAGVRPAINVGLSVSRVGGSAQTKIMKKVAGKLRLELATYRELATFAQFASDMDKATQQKLSRGKRMVEMLKQMANNPVGFEKQSVLIYAGINGYLDEIEVEQVLEFERMLYEKMDTSHADLTKTILERKELTSEIEHDIKLIIVHVVEEIKMK